MCGLWPYQLKPNGQMMKKMKNDLKLYPRLDSFFPQSCLCYIKQKEFFFYGLTLL